MSDQFDEGAEDSGDESVPVERDGKGRFRGSGNPRGRPFRIPRDPKLPASRRRVLNEVADMPVTVKIDGVAREMSLYHANALCLAKAGTTDRVAASKFIDLMMQVADTDLLRRLTGRMTMDRMNEREEQLARLQAVQNPNGSVMIPIALSDWDPERMVDDETGVIDATRDWIANPPARKK